MIILTLSKSPADGTISLSGIIPDQGSGFGALGFTESGIQNGIDGLALVDERNNVLQFLSYEGERYSRTDRRF